MGDANQTSFIWYGADGPAIAFDWVYPPIHFRDRTWNRSFTGASYYDRRLELDCTPANCIPTIAFVPRNARIYFYRRPAHSIPRH